jgi:hypothetical protein
MANREPREGDVDEELRLSSKIDLLLTLCREALGLESGATTLDFGSIIQQFDEFDFNFCDENGNLLPILDVVINHFIGLMGLLTTIRLIKYGIDHCQILLEIISKERASSHEKDVDLEGKQKAVEQALVRLLWTLEDLYK